MLCLVHATGGTCECEFYSHFPSPYAETVQCPLYVLSLRFSKLFLLSLHITRVPRLFVCLCVCLFDHLFQDMRTQTHTHRINYCLLRIHVQIHVYMRKREMSCDCTFASVESSRMLTWQMG
ncbi:hypothetical protein CRM22_006920 [Opisthorchis felineus]|uniref:Uncharacterized protein n=1 Tax=Opisthorchis felineus TaxID=147828 RepID=A0A4S2LIU4_OPIFE|nr:hypothetical protein CRM22_006920 [Opisthorchis felineus]